MFNVLLGQYPGINGFLGSRGSFMLDFVFLAMFAVVPLMCWGISLAKQRKFTLHKRVQLALALILLVAVTAFEIEMRMVGWEERAEPSPYWMDSGWNDVVHYALGIHLFFAIPTALIWIYVVVQAMRLFPTPAKPSKHSPSHRYWGMIASVEMFMTAVTGWIFYYVAFVAT